MQVSATGLSPVAPTVLLGVGGPGWDSGGSPGVKRIVIVPYADEVSLCLKNVGQLEHAMVHIQRFERVSGAKLNVQKTNVMAVNGGGSMSGVLIRSAHGHREGFSNTKKLGHGQRQGEVHG